VAFAGNTHSDGFLLFYLDEIAEAFEDILSNSVDISVKL